MTCTFYLLPLAFYLPHSLLLPLSSPSSPSPFSNIVLSFNQRARCLAFSRVQEGGYIRCHVRGAAPALLVEWGAALRAMRYRRINGIGPHQSAIEEDEEEGAEEEE